MPVEQDWLIPDHLASVRFFGDVTLHDVGVAFGRSAELVDASGGKQVHFLHDWQDVTSYPTNVIQIRQALQARVSDRSKLGWVVIYGMDHQLLRFLSHIALELFKVRVKQLETRIDAITFLYHIDPALPEIPKAPKSPA